MAKFVICPHQESGPVSDQKMEDFLILRVLEEPVTQDELVAAGEYSGQVVEELQNEGVGIRWVESDVMSDESGRVTGTLCHYKAQDEEAVREHADRAGLPATRIDRRAEPIEPRPESLSAD